MSEQMPRLVGINHVAIEVGDVDAALAFYGSIFSFSLRGTHRDADGGLAMAFLDMGDQFLALSQGRTQAPDDHRHFGLVVDDRTRVLDMAIAAGGTLVDGASGNFRDPWGNRIEVVDYKDIQFTKASAVLEAMGLALEKTASAEAELREKGVA